MPIDKMKNPFKLTDTETRKYLDLYNDNIDVKEIFKRIKTLPLIKPEYVIDKKIEGKESVLI